MLLPALLNLLALAAILTTAAPTPAPRQKGGAGTLTASSILFIDPDTSDCSSAPFPKECRTAAQAAPYISLSFNNFGIASFGAQAALLSLILYETGSLKYNHNHYPAPGRPGQGTRNMQMPEFNLAYAEWLASTCANCGISQAAVEQAKGRGVDVVLALVNTDQWGFSSAAWFLSTQCDGSVMEGLARGDQAGWETYLTSCVQTTVTEERTAVWRKAVALGHW